MSFLGPFIYVAAIAVFAVLCRVGCELLDRAFPPKK